MEIEMFWKIALGSIPILAVMVAAYYKGMRDCENNFQERNKEEKSETTRSTEEVNSDASTEESDDHPTTEELTTLFSLNSPFRGKKFLVEIRDKDIRWTRIETSIMNCLLLAGARIQYVEKVVADAIYTGNPSTLTDAARDEVQVDFILLGKCWVDDDNEYTINFRLLTGDGKEVVNSGNITSEIRQLLAETLVLHIAETVRTKSVPQSTNHNTAAANQKEAVGVAQV